MQFDPDAAVASVDRLMGLAPRAINLTHYRAHLYGRLDAHGCDVDPAWREEIVGQDVKLNAQGLQIWLSRLARA